MWDYKPVATPMDAHTHLTKALNNYKALKNFCL